MSVMLICAAHTPLMAHLTPGNEVTQPILDTLDIVSENVRSFDPELVIVFGPDHFAGFFYDLMPSFCVGIQASAMGDFGISTDGQSYRVPEELARKLVSSLHEGGVDVAMSMDMRADHGFAQSLEHFAGGVGHYPTIPIFINSAAPPLPPMARAQRLGAEVGRFLATTGKRVLLIGSGGLSHDPPIPDILTATSPVREVLISGRNPSPERMQAKLQRNIETARALNAGSDSVIALNPEWDTHFMDLLLAGDIDAMARLDMEEARAVAGVGVNEVRTWVAAAAAFEAMGARGPYVKTVQHYTPVPLWNAGFGIVAAVANVSATRMKNEEALWI